MKPVGLRDPRTGKLPGPSFSCARKTFAPTPTTSSASRTTSSTASRPASFASSPASKTPRSCATARSTATPTSTRPTLLTETLQLRAHPSILFAGQLSGVEGYTESIAHGLLAGRYAAALAHGTQPRPPRAPPPTARSSTTSPTRKVGASSPPTSPSTSFPRSKTTSAAASATRKNATESNASAPSPHGTSGSHNRRLIRAATVFPCYSHRTHL